MRAILLSFLFFVFPFSSLKADKGSLIDGVEHVFGASNINAITGHGQLSVGVSQDGDLSVISWPNPSFTDQLAYISSNDINTRSQKRYGAPEGAGMFFLLLLENEKNEKTVTRLGRNHDWQISQKYLSDRSSQIETNYESKKFGLIVKVTDSVSAPKAIEEDILVRQVKIKKTGTAKYKSIHLISYANLSPTPKNSKLPELPFADWLMDGRNDFGAVWNSKNKSIVHFHPKDQKIFNDVGFLLSPPPVNYGEFSALLKESKLAKEKVQALAESLDKEFAEGSYIAFSTLPKPQSFQIGYDSTPFCDLLIKLADNIIDLPNKFKGIELPVPTSLVNSLKCDEKAKTIPKNENWVHQAQDAYLDLKDAKLSENTIAAGEVNEVLQTKFDFAGKEEAEITAVLAFAKNASTAEKVLDSVKSGKDIFQEHEDYHKKWLENKVLPKNSSKLVETVALRSLQNVHVGTDKASGAIVASISRQAPYGLDWPRDGAFFNVLLDYSGQHELVDKRMELYANWQRKKPLLPHPLVDQKPPQDPDDPKDKKTKTYPAYAWEMNYYADGLVGGNWRFEIDGAAFVIWTMVAHVGWTKKDPKKYLESLWETIESGANLLTRWKNKENNLTADAQEDDTHLYTSTLHGNITVFGALDLASRAAQLIGKTEQAKKWQNRAREIHEAIFKEFYDPKKKAFKGEMAKAFNPGSTIIGPTAWAVWPMTCLPLNDQRIKNQLLHDLEIIKPQINLETEGATYFMKNTTSLAFAQKYLPEKTRKELQELVAKAASHASPSTHQFGEVMIKVKKGDKFIADQRVSNPHLWEGTLFFLTVAALENPEAISAYDKVLPPSPFYSIANKKPEDSGGCSCGLSNTQKNNFYIGALLLLGLLSLLLIRRFKINTI